MHFHAGRLASMISIIFVCLGAAMVLISEKALKKASTTTNMIDEPTALVTSGPYSYCRNPMYFGMVLVLFGLFFFMGSTTAMLVIFIFGGILEDRFIRPEEVQLQEKFGNDYTQYKARVSKWFPLLTTFAYDKTDKSKKDK
jgi:protein-S-isoprenylcysteine O-methyltransferase Ste14